MADNKRWGKNDRIVKIARVVQKVTYWPTFLILKFFIHYQVEGQENLKGLEDKGVIFASNHASYLDSTISTASMPRDLLYPDKFFPICSLAYDRLFKIKGHYFSFPLSLFVSAYVIYNGSIPVAKAGGDLQKALGSAVNALKDGIKIWIFPEGRMTMDGKLQIGQRGVAFLHQQTGAPIVPVALIGTFGILSKGLLLRKKRVKVKIGKPIYLLEGSKEKDFSLEAGAEEVMSAIAELMGEGQGLR